MNMHYVKRFSYSIFYLAAFKFLTAGSKSITEICEEIKEYIPFFKSFRCDLWGFPDAVDNYGLFQARRCLVKSGKSTLFSSPYLMGTRYQ